MQGRFSSPGTFGPTSVAAFRAPTAGGNMRKNWVQIAQLASALNGLADGVQLNADQQNALKAVRTSLGAFYPFQLYNFPSVLRTTPDPANDWRKFRVRAGQVLGVNATGTDVNNANPDGETLAAGDMTDVVVPVSTSGFWFWLEKSGSSWIVRYGTDATATRYPATGTALWTSTNAWTGAPVPDATHIPIGTVDTLTAAASNTAIVRQLLRADVESVGAGGGNAQATTITAVGHNDYFVTGLGTVYKAFWMRASLASATIDGVPVTFTYTDENTRTASDGTNTQIEVAYPPFQVGDNVYVVPAIGTTPGDSTPILLDGTSRVWARRYVQ